MAWTSKQSNYCVKQRKPRKEDTTRNGSINWLVRLSIINDTIRSGNAGGAAPANEMIV